MPAWLFNLTLLVIISLLSGCGHDDPQAALEAAVQQLQLDWWQEEGQWQLARLNWQ